MLGEINIVTKNLFNVILSITLYMVLKKEWDNEFYSK